MTSMNRWGPVRDAPVSTMNHASTQTNSSRQSRRALLKSSLALVAPALGGDLLFCSNATAVPADRPELKVGLAGTCITPSQPVWLHGYAGKSRFRPYTGVLDDIHARAMAIQDGDGQPAVLITADLCVLRQPEETELSKRLTAKTGLPRGRFLLNWSHTHSGPIIGTTDLSRYPMPAEDVELTTAYTQELWDKLAQLAADAIAELKPARLGWGHGRADFVVNRRLFKADGTYRGMGPNHKAWIDRDVPVLRIDRPDGTLRGVVFGCACHPVTLGGSSTKLSGDYPGFARTFIEKTCPGVRALFMQGCGADANSHPRSCKNQEQIVQQQGRSLGEEVCRVLAGKLSPVGGPFRAEFVRTELPLVPVPPLAQLKKMAKGPFWKSHNAKAMLAAIEHKRPIPTHYKAPLALWQFGNDLTLVAISGEVVSDFVPLVGKVLDNERLWVAGYSNQVFGYLPSARIVKEGGYESLGLVSVHPGWFSADAQDVVLAAIRKMAQ